MNKHFRKLDAIAAALLAGTVGTMALAQVAPPPTWVWHWCDSQLVPVWNGEHYTIVAVAGAYCPIGTTCDPTAWMDPVTGNIVTRMYCSAPA